MSEILTPVPFPDDPTPARPRLAAITCAAIECSPWCADRDGHHSAVNQTEQVCRGVAHRIDTRLGGGNAQDPTLTSFASVVLQAEQVPGKQPTIALGVQLGGDETFAQLTPAELKALVGYANLVLDDLVA